MADAEPTLAAGAPEPRAASLLVGHDDAERVLRQAWDSGRLAHAWLIHGPRGVGKATLAYRFARFVLAHGAFEKDALDPAKGLLGVSPESRLWRRIASGSHGGLFVLEPGYDEQRGRPRSEIMVDEVRRLVGFLTLTPGEGIWRVAIVDSADALNRHAANALLKMLEEPPARVVFLLLSENPSALLATLRSRCRRLALRPVGTSEIERLLRLHRPDLTGQAARTLAEIADGSPGQAIELAEEEGAELFGAVFRLIGELPELKTAAVHALAAIHGDTIFRAGLHKTKYSLTDVFFDTALQQMTEPSRRGAVFGASMATMSTTMMAGVALAPLLAGAFAPSAIFWVVAGALGVAGGIGLLASASRHSTAILSARRSA